MGSTEAGREIDLQLILQKISEQTQDLSHEDDLKSLLKKTLNMLKTEYDLCPYLFRLSGELHNINWQADHLSQIDIEETDKKFISSVTRALSLLDPRKDIYFEGVNHATVAGYEIDFISLKLLDCSTAVLFGLETT